MVAFFGLGRYVGRRFPLLAKYFVKLWIIKVTLTLSKNSHRVDRVSTELIAHDHVILLINKVY